MIEKERFRVHVLIGGDVNNNWESELEDEHIV